MVTLFEYGGEALRVSEGTAQALGFLVFALFVFLISR